jgi:hypothetical protein
MALSGLIEMSAYLSAFGVKRTCRDRHLGDVPTRMTELGPPSKDGGTVPGSPHLGDRTRWQIATSIQNNSGRPIRLACRPVAG